MASKEDFFAADPAGERYDVLLRGGHLVDTRAGIDGLGDLAIRGDRIAAIGKLDPSLAATVVDAAGYYVTPGLVDYHAHVNEGGDWAGAGAEAYAFQNGVTAIVDSGSVGCGNYAAFYNGIVKPSRVDITTFLFVGSCGQFITNCHHDQSPRHIDAGGILALAARRRDNIVGLKVKISREFVGEHGLEPLRCAVDLGGKAGLRVSAHATDPADSYANIFRLLRPGDIFCHTYHGKGDTILAENSRVKPEVLAAREAGVLFDAAHGRTANFSLAVARQAIREGFYPDLITSDYTLLAARDRYPFFMMLSEYLAMGMSFTDIIKRCTEVPRALLSGRNDPLLEVGRTADIAVFGLESREIVFRDHFGNQLAGNRLIRPKMTIKSGVPAFDQLF